MRFEHLTRRTSTGRGVVVLVHDSELVGFCEYGQTEDADDDPRRVGHVMRLYVHPERQGRGGGRLLISAACAQLARDGYEHATLWTLDDPSNRAHGFYVHEGWISTGVLNDTEPPDVRYRKRLVSGG